MEPTKGSKLCIDQLIDLFTSWFKYAVTILSNLLVDPQMMCVAQGATRVREAEIQNTTESEPSSKDPMFHMADDPPKTFLAWEAPFTSFLSSARMFKTLSWS